MDTIEIITGYTFRELQDELARVRGTGMPRSTLYNWLSALKIKPGIDGLYSSDDLETLKDLNRFLKRCPSIDKFINARFCA